MADTAGVLLSVLAEAGTWRRALVAVLLAGGLLAGPWSSSAIADGLVVVLSPSTIAANGTSTTNVTVACGTENFPIACGGDQMGIAVPGGQKVSITQDGGGELIATLTSTEIAGPWPVVGVDDTQQTTATATLTQTPGPAAASAGGIYWSDPSNTRLINGASLAGTNPISVTDSNDADFPQGLAGAGVGPVFAAGADGVDVAARDLSVEGNLVSLPYSPIQWVAANNSYVYWINGGSINTAADSVPAGTIGRANLDGSDVIPDLITPEGVTATTGWYPTSGLAVDGSHVYWANPDGIGRANLDGTDVDQDFITDPDRPTAVAASGGYLYWADLLGRDPDGLLGGDIARAYIGDGDANPGVDPDFITTQYYATDVAVDGSHLYWNNFSSNPLTGVPGTTIGRANLDGSDVIQNFITDPNNPDFVAATSPSPALVLSAPSIAANGSSTSTATMTVTDQFGNPLSGEDVAITSSNPSQRVGPVTNPSPGVYQATITSTSTPGSATITGTDNTPATPLTATATLTQTGPPARVAVALAPGSIMASGTSTSIATATVTDRTGNLLTGQTVKFASSGGQKIGPISAMGPGTFQATITSTKVAGTATITATDTTPSEPLVGKATLTQPAGAVMIGVVHTNGKTALVPVSCSAGGPCAISLALGVSETLSGGKVIAVTAKAKRKTHRGLGVGAASASIAAGASRTVAISLNKAGLALLSEYHHLAVKVTLTETGGPATTRTITFRGPGAPAVVKVSIAKSTVTVLYALRAPARITLSVAPVHRRATVVAHATGQAGLDKITWNRKLKGKMAKPGKYVLTIRETVDGLSNLSTRTIRL